MDDLPTGQLLRHYKGTRYVVLHRATHSDGAPTLVYCALSGAREGQIFTRPLSEFFDPMIWPDGKPRTRFVKD